MKKIISSLTVIMMFVNTLAAEYLEPERKDREYELDLITQEFPRSWEKQWRASDSGLWVSGGSVNVRDLLFLNNLKFKFNLAPKLDLKGDFNFYQAIASDEILRHDINRIDTFDITSFKNIFAFEYNFQKNWFVSLLGNPTFEKQRSDLGIGITYKLDSLNYINLNYWWIDFDNNHAYKKEKEFDNKEEIYSGSPREITFSFVHNTDKVYWYFETAYDKKIKKEYIFYDNPTTNYIRQTQADFLKSLIEYKINTKINTGLEIYRETNQDNREFTISLTQNYQSDYSKYYLSPYLGYKINQKLKLNFECRYQKKKYEQELPNDSVNNYHYKKTEIFPLYWVDLVISPNWSMEIGYLREVANLDRIFPNQEWLNSHKDSLVDDRLKIGVEYKLGKNLTLKALTGVELDKRDQGKFPYLDKGAMQFITAF